MSVEIEGLEFQIESNSEQAAKGIDSLATSFSKLKKALKGNALEKASKNLKTISDLNLDMSGVEKISNLTEGMSKLGEVKISSTVPKRLSEIGTAIDGITESGIERVADLASTLERLQSVQIPNMSGLGQTGTSAAGTGAVDAAGTGAATSEVENYNSSVSQASMQTNRLKSILNGMGGVFSKAFSIGSTALKGFLNIVGKGVGSVKSLVNQTKKLGSTIGSKLSAKVKQATSGFTGLFSSIKRIAMYRLIRSFFSQLTNAMKEGINNLYQYSTLMGTTFKDSMDSLATSFQYLKNSMGAMVSPIINSLAPAIDYLIDKFVSLLNIVNQFFARLTGASTYTAAKKAAASYADSLGDTASAATDAAKEIKDATTGIDELNIISQNDTSSSGSSGTDYASMFETLPLDSTISDFVDKLKQAFEAGDWKTLGTLLGEKFNEIVDSIDWSGIGSKVGYAINGAVQTAYYFLDTADFTNLGNHVAELINSALEEIDFTYVGRLWVKKFTSALDFFIGLLGGLDWGLIGTSVGDFLRGAFDEVSDWISGIDWGAMADSLYENIKSFLAGVDFASLAQSFFTMFGKALAAAVSFIGTFIFDIVEDIKSYFLQYIEDENGDGKFGGLEIVQGLLNGILDGIWNIGTWIKENVFDPFVDGFKSVFGIHSPSTVMYEIGDMIVQGFMNGINLFSTVSSKAKEWAGKVVEWFTKGEDGVGVVENFKNLGSNVVTGFKDKVGSTYTNVKANVTTWAGKVKEWFSNSAFGGINSTTFSTYAGNVINGFKNKVSSGYTVAKTSVTTWATKTKSWFTDVVSYDSFYNIAADVINGFKNGIGALYTTCKDTITKWGSSIISWFKEKLDSNSPSKVFYQIGSDTILGYNNAISAVGKTTRGLVNKWADSFTDVSPTLALAADTSALSYYDSDAFARSVSANVDNQYNVYSDSLADALDTFYAERVEPALNRIVTATETQADKKEQTVVQIGSRTITDEVKRQEKANGYSFTK